MKTVQQQLLAAPEAVLARFFTAWCANFGKLTQEQVVGLEWLLREISSRWPLLEQGKLAYILATVHWETAKRFEPVREAYYLPFAEQDRERWRQKHLARYYPYYGRGYIQITWKTNYQWLAEITEVDVVSNPDLALQREVALQALVRGMLEGQFGRPLGRYFTATKADWVGARGSVNGQDRAEAIAKVAQAYYRCLESAKTVQAGA